MQPHSLAAAALLAGLAATLPAHSQTVPASGTLAKGPAARKSAQVSPADPTGLNTQPSPAVAEKVEPRTDDPSVQERRNAELLYEVLLGEMTAGSGDPGSAYSLMLDAARKTGDERLYRRAAEIALQARAGDAALAAATAWKQAKPTSREANRYVLQILLALNRVEATAEPLAREIALSPAATRAALYMALQPLYGRVTDKKAAQAVVEAALAPDLRDRAPTDTAIAAWVTAGRMRFAAGDTAGTLDAARRAQAIDPTAEGPAILALELMDPKQPLAEPIVQRYLASGKPLPELRLGYARALMDAQRNAEATRELQTLTVEQPRFAEGWLLRGAQEAQDEQYAAAEQSIKTYLDLAQGTVAPNRPAEAEARGLDQAYLVMAQIAEKRGDTAAANGWLDRVQGTQALVSAQARRASLLARQGRLAEGQQLIRQLPQRTPADARMKLMAEVQLLRDHGRQAEAYDLLQQAQKQAPTDNDLLYDLAMSAEKLGRFEDMERMLRELVARQPDYHHAYNALGYSLAERNQRLPEARDLIKKALEFAPNDPFINDSLGWVEFRLGNRAEAIRMLEAAFKQRPDAEIAAHLGEVLWADGQRDRARAIWKEGLLLNRTNDTLQQTLQRLKVRL